MSGAPHGATLARLLPRGELRVVLSALSLLLPNARWVVLEPSGQRYLEHGASAPGAVTLRTPLALQGVAVATLELVVPRDAHVAAPVALEALRVVLEQALAAGALRRELAAETLERYREVHLAYRLAELLSGAVEVETLPGRVIGEAVRVVRAPCAVAVLAGDVAAAVGVDAVDPALRPMLAAAHARSGGRTVIETEPLGTSVEHERRHAVRLWAPLQVGDDVIGGLLLTRPAGDAVFTAGDAKLLGALAAQAATIIQNARLHAAAVAQARLAQELQLAHDVQAKLMPSTLPAGDGWSLAAWWSAAREVAGDFYDATGHDGVVMVTVGDVADKGMAAALFMALSRSVLRASAGDGRGPAEVVARANALLCADASDGMFVTLAHAHLARDGTVRYANAGHNPPLLLRADGGLERLERTGILVGWDDAARYGEARVRLGAGDALVLYTDGVTEARDEGGAEYTEARLLERLRTLVAGGADAATIVAALRTDLLAFVGDAEPFDDATLLVAVRTDAPAVGTADDARAAWT